MASRKVSTASASKRTVKVKPAGASKSRRAPVKREPILDAIGLLKKDHARVKKLLQDLVGASKAATDRRQQLLKEIEHEVRTHTHLEEEMFYPAFKESIEHSDEHIYYEAIEEHTLVDLVLVQIKSSDVKSEQFSAKAKVLKDLIEHHAEEEETEMFPKARKVLGTVRLRELGQRMEAARHEVSLNILTKVAVAAGSTLAKLMKRGAVSKPPTTEGVDSGRNV